MRRTAGCSGECFSMLGAVAVTFASIPPTAHATSRDLPASVPTASSPPGSSLRVAVAPSIADAPLLTQWLEERNTELGDALALPGHAQWIDVQIDGATYEYDVNVVAMRDGEPLAPSSAPIVCECTSGSLLAMLDREISSAVYRLRSTPIGARPPEPTPTPTVATPERVSSSAGADVRPPRPRLWSISPLGVAGAATGAFGLIALGAGSAFVVAEPHPIDGWSKLDRDLAPLGYATLSVGAAALAGGVAMIVIDALRVRRRSRLAVAPTHGRGTVGAIFVRRR